MSEAATKLALLDRLLASQSWPERRVARLREAFRHEAHIAGLRARAWHAPESCAWLAPLRDHFREGRGWSPRRSARPHAAPTGGDAEHGTPSGWALLRFLMQRVLYDDHLEACPQVAQYLEHLQRHFPTAGLWASVMEAGVELPPHRGADNTVVRAHVGVLVPEGCALSVDGEARPFVEGEALVFEPSFVHAAWNRNPEGRARVVLSIDVWHPDLTTHEVAALQFIERALSEGEPAG